MTKLVIEAGKITIADFSQRRRVEIFKSEEEEFTICIVNTHKSTRNFMTVSEWELKEIIKAAPRLFE